MQYDEDGTNVWNSCNSHLMTNYKATLNNEEINRGFIQLACEEDTLNENKSIESENDDAESIDVITDFSIEENGKILETMGLDRHSGAIVAFDGTHCNYYSPYDTYTFYYDGSNYRLEVVGLLGDTCSFTVNIVDNDNIEVIDVYGAVRLMWIE